MRGHLAALVPGEGPPQVLGHPFEQLDEPGERRFRGVALWQIGEETEPACPVEDRDDRRSVAGPDDQVAFEVTDLGAIIRDRRSEPDQVEPSERTVDRRWRPENPVFAASVPPVQPCV